MKAFEELIKNISIRYQDQIKKSCRPLLDHFGVNNFNFGKITNSGFFTTLFSNPDWMEYYFSEKFHMKQPHLRNPKNVQSGISVCKSIKNEEYEEMGRIASNKFNINFGIGIITKVSDGYILVGIDTNSLSPNSTLLLSELPVIQKFVSYFQSENQNIIEALDNYKVDLRAELGSKFDNADIPIIMKPIDREGFLKKIGVNVTFSLSLREKTILRYILNGYSAREISRVFNLSPRTIEHSIEHLKNKLSCFSKGELVRKARELELLGYLA